MPSFGPQMGQNCIFNPKDFLVNFTFAIYIYLLQSVMPQSLKKVLSVNTEIIAFISLGHNCTFGPKEDFWENFT